VLLRVLQTCKGEGFIWKLVDTVTTKSRWVWRRRSLSFLCWKSTMHPREWWCYCCAYMHHRPFLTNLHRHHPPIETQTLFTLQINTIETWETSHGQMNFFHFPKPHWLEIQYHLWELDLGKKKKNLNSTIQSFTGRPEEMVQIVPKHCKIRNAWHQHCWHIPCHQFMDAEKPSTQNPTSRKPSTQIQLLRNPKPKTQLPENPQPKTQLPKKPSTLNPPSEKP